MKAAEPRWAHAATLTHSMPNSSLGCPQSSLSAFERPHATCLVLTAAKLVRAAPGAVRPPKALHSPDAIKPQLLTPLQALSHSYHGSFDSSNHAYLLCFCALT